MVEVWYEQTEDTAVLKTDTPTEWLESDSVVCLSEWI